VKLVIYWGLMEDKRFIKECGEISLNDICMEKNK